MRMLMRVGMAAGLAGMLLVAVGARPEDDASARPKVQTKPVKADVADLAWLAGSWHAKAGAMEEHWSQPAGGTLVGMFRMLDGKGGTHVTEFLMIVQEGEHVRLRFKHYDTRLVPWEKDAPLEFHCLKLTDREAIFDSNVQRNPKRLSYRLIAPQRLQVTVHQEVDGRVVDEFVIEFERRD